MSPALLLELRSGFDERMAGLGQRFERLTTGEEWDGILLAVPPVDPAMDLGEDLRERATMECRRDSAPELEYGEIVIQKRPFWSLTGDAPSPRWSVTRREDNPANFAIRYWLIKVTDKDARAT